MANPDEEVYALTDKGNANLKAGEQITILVVQAVKSVLGLVPASSAGDKK